MTAALDLLQWRHDMAEPDSKEAFIDTTDGQNWLAGAVDDLIEDTLYVAGRRVTEQVMQLESALAERVAAKYSAGEDYDGALGQVLRNVLAGDIDKASGALRLLVSKDEARSMAEGLVRPLAQQYAESQGEDDYE